MAEENNSAFQETNQATLGEAGKILLERRNIEPVDKKGEDTVNEVKGIVNEGESMQC